MNKKARIATAWITFEVLQYAVTFLVAVAIGALMVAFSSGSEGKPTVSIGTNNLPVWAACSFAAYVLSARLVGKVHFRNNIRRLAISWAYYLGLMFLIGVVLVGLGALGLWGLIAGIASAHEFMVPLMLLLTWVAASFSAFYVSYTVSLEKLLAPNGT